MFLVTRKACGLKSKGVVGVENDRWYRRVSELAGKEADLLGVSGSDGWRINLAVNGKTGLAARCRGGSVIGGELWRQSVLTLYLARISSLVIRSLVPLGFRTFLPQRIKTS